LLRRTILNVSSLKLFIEVSYSGHQALTEA
jgi:hypothetical protein